MINHDYEIEKQAHPENFEPDYNFEEPEEYEIVYGV